MHVIVRLCYGVLVQHKISCSCLLFILFLTVSTVGYRTVALNRVVEESAFDVQGDKKKKRKGEKDVIVPIPPPLNLDDIPDVSCIVSKEKNHCIC